jgi:hypothetical protein
MKMGKNVLGVVGCLCAFLIASNSAVAMGKKQTDNSAIVIPDGKKNGESVKAAETKISSWNGNNDAVELVINGNIHMIKGRWVQDRGATKDQVEIIRSMRILDEKGGLKKEVSLLPKNAVRNLSIDVFSSRRFVWVKRSFGDLERSYHQVLFFDNNGNQLFDKPLDKCPLIFANDDNSTIMFVYPNEAELEVFDISGARKLKKCYSRKKYIRASMDEDSIAGFSSSSARSADDNYYLLARNPVDLGSKVVPDVLLIDKGGTILFIREIMTSRNVDIIEPYWISNDKRIVVYIIYDRNKIGDSLISVVACDYSGRELWKRDYEWFEMAKGTEVGGRVKITYLKNNRIAYLNLVNGLVSEK